MTAALNTSTPVTPDAVVLPERPNITLVLPTLQVKPSAVVRGPFAARPMLTDREVEVLLSWIRCDSKIEVAKSMFLSLGTVNTHLTRIRAKYAAIGRPAPTKAALVARALQDGLVDIAEL